MPDATPEYLLVFSRARDGRVEEFRSWYDQTHIPEILAKLPDTFTAARRTDLVGGDFDSLAEYEVAGSAREAWAAVTVPGTLTRGDALDYAATRVLFASA